MASLSQTLNSQIDNLTQEILRDPLHGKKIYLLGSAEFGPTNEPIRIKSTVGLYNKFGKTGSLIDAFHAVKYTTKNNEVYLVKTTGQHAVTYLNVNILQDEIIQNGFILSASESNEYFNDVQIELTEESLIIRYPLDLNIPEHELTYDYETYYNIELLANAINKDTKNKRSYINANYTVQPDILTKHAFFVCNPSKLNLYGGQCGLNYSKNLLYTSLEKTYEILESFPIDIIIPVDAFLDDLYPDDSENEEFQYNMKYYQPTKDYLTADTLGNQRTFMDQLINFCINQLNFGQVTTGVLGFNPVYTWTTNYLYESDNIVEMYKHCFDYNKHLCTNKDYSFLVSVVAGDIAYNKGTLIDNGYLAYGAFNASIQLNIGNTNIKVSDSIDLYNEFSEEKLAYLAENGIVTFRHSPLYDSVVVYDGVTAFNKKESFLTLYCNIRMIQLCISYLNKLYQFYIGLNFNELMDKGKIEKDTEHILSILASRNVITEYDFRLTPDYKKGYLTVELELLTNYMTKSLKIRSVIKINSEE